MESDMVNEQFDNKYGLTYEQTLNVFDKLLNHFFQDSFALKEAKNFGMSFKLEYIIENCVLIFRSERSYIEEYVLLKDNNRIDLIGYEPMLQNIEVTSHRNIEFLLSTIKRFLNESTH